MNSLKSKLNEAAKKALTMSYSPYSQKKIGASLLLSNGQIFSGCNVENASYGGTVCAERVAVLKAISECSGREKITEIVVASAEDKPWPPCGLCLQVIAEFSTDETLIRLINLKETELTYKFKELFPQAFQPNHLLK